MPHLFISYKRENFDFVREIEQHIKQADIDVWTDAQIHAGENWRSRIDEAIHESFAVIVVMTPAARHSEYVTYEWAFAMGLGKPVLPLMLEQTDFHPKLFDVQYLDFTQINDDKWLQLLNAVKLLAPENAIGDVPLAVQRAEDVLNDYDPTVREHGIETLKQMTPNPAAIMALGRAVSHVVLDVRQMAINTLDDICTSINVDVLKQFIPDLETCLKDDNPEICLKALHILENIKDEAATNLIETATKNPQPEIRSVAIQSIAKIKGQDALDSVSQTLEDTDTTVRAAAIQAIRIIGTPEAAQRLANITDEVVPALKLNAMAVLMELGSTKSFAIFYKLLNDDDMNVRLQAFKAMLDFQNAPLEKALQQAVTQAKYMDIRLTALHQLQERNIEITTKTWQRILSDNRSEMQVEALQAISKKAASDVIITIEALLDNDNQKVRNTAFDVILQLDSQDGELALIRALVNSAYSYIRLKAFNHIQTRQITIPVAIWHKVLQDDEPAIHSAAMIVLADEMQEDLLPRIEELLLSVDVEARQSAVQALKRIISPKVIPLLGIFAEDSNSQIRKEAIQYLLNLHSPTAYEELRHVAASTKDLTTQIEILEAILQNSPSVLGPIVCQLIQDTDKRLREIGTQALGHADSTYAMPCLREILPKMSRHEQREFVQNASTNATDTLINTLGDLASARDVDTNIHMLAIRVLIKIGNDKAAEALAKPLYSPDSMIHLPALEALIDIKSDKAKAIVAKWRKERSNT